MGALPVGAPPRGSNITARGAWPGVKETQPPPAPRPAREGSVTASTKPIATAASAAEPPADSTVRPARAALGSSATAAPAKPLTWPGTPIGGAGGPNNSRRAELTIPQPLTRNAAAERTARPRNAILEGMTRMVSLLLALLLAVGRTLPALAQGAPRRAAPRIELIRDAETETLLRTFANPLFRAAGIDPHLVRIMLVRDDAINSFVGTGNRMFINTGLIEQLHSAAELVGVIAHETGHIAGGHLARLPMAMRAASLESLAAMLIGAAAAAASGSGGAMLAGIGAQQMAMRNFLSFDRSIEASADAAAVTFLDRLHWTARGLLELFDQLRNQEALLPDQQDPYLQTHPLTSARISFMRAHVRTDRWSNAPLPAGFESGFRMVRAKLRAFLEPSSLTLSRIRSNDPAPAARYARAIALYRLGHSREAIAILDGLLRQAPANPWFHEMKAQVLFDAGQARAAIPEYQAALRYAPLQPLLEGELAQAMVETGDPARLRPAVAALQVALAREPDDAGNWHELGLAWGRLGDMGPADLALAEEQLRRGNRRAATSFAERARHALPPGPARQRAADIAHAVAQMRH